MKKTKIEWCDVTINPVVGCKTGCAYCYARNLNARFKWLDDFAEPQFFPQRLEELKTLKNSIVFLNSMSDIEYWKLSWLIEILATCLKYPTNAYCVLTKSWMRFPSLGSYDVVLNIGKTVTCQADFKRWIDLVDYDFLSIEPIHELIKLPQKLETKWIIVGAETGNRAGKILPEKEWIFSLIDQCKKKRIPLFMKNSLVDVVGAENMLRQYPTFIEKIGGKRKYNGC